jgi:tRNA pseudouridine38-40 synthase
MRTLKLTITYDGTNYAGWQRQKNVPTIQQTFEESWKKITGEEITITGSGRTDSGVHARRQVCSLETQSALDCNRLLRAVNANMPTDISIVSAIEVGDDFNAITHAVEKTYQYYIQSGRILDPLRQRYAWFVPYHLDADTMDQAAALFVGAHDFASFQATGSVRQSTVRTVIHCSVELSRRGPFEDVTITVTANGFLYNMVRNIVGTLVLVGRGLHPPEWITWLLDQKDRKLAGQTAPAHGLFMDHVVYRDENLG